LTHLDTRRNILFVGPLVAVDSEWNLRTFRISGALGAAPARFSDMSPAAHGDLDVAVPFTPASTRVARCGHGAVDRACKPPASRHRRGSPGPA
jgi:hypothetical protein